MLKWGILGSSRIASKAVPLLQTTDQVKISAIASRSPERARDFALQFGIRETFPNYEALINSSEVNAIYITLPNDQHFYWAKFAMEHGKHVLCEKPLVLNLQQAQELKEISTSTGCVLMEGFMYRHHNQILILKDLLGSSKKIGTLQSIYSSFHFTMPDGPNIRLSTEQGGGALLDLGCYCIDLSNYLFSIVPQRVLGSAFLDSSTPKNEMPLGPSVDLAFNGIMDYGQGKTATFDCSFQGLRKTFVQIVGTNGFLRLENPFKGGPLEIIEITTDGGTERIEITDELNPFIKEFINFQEAIAGKALPLVSLDETIVNMKTIDDLRSSAICPSIGEKVIP